MGAAKDVAGAAALLKQRTADEVFLASLPSHARQYGADLLRAASETGVSPYLLAAIAEQESDYGQALSPKGPTGSGDGGHGRGLMQIDDRSHQGFLAQKNAMSVPLWQVPLEAFRYAAGILKQSQAYFTQQPKAGAKVVVKATDYAATLGTGKVNPKGVPPGTYADPRPLSGDVLAAAVLASYNTGAGNVLKAVAAGKPADTTTTVSKRSTGAVLYATSVLERMKRLVGA